MRTFDHSIDPPSFWWAVIVPPVFYWASVMVLTHVVWPARVPPEGLLILVALAFGLPLAALGWTVCSVCAYTVGGSELTIHRVLRDQRFRLAEICGPVVRRGAQLQVSLPDRALLLRPADPEGFLAALQEHAPGCRIAAGTPS